MLFSVRIGLLCAGTAGMLTAAAFLFLSRNEKLPSAGLKVFAAEDLFSAGERLRLILEKTNWMPRRSVSALEKKLDELYTPAQAKDIEAAALAAPYTYLLIFMPVLMFMCAAGESAELLICGLVFIAFLCCYFDLWLSEKLKKRHMSIMLCYPSMLTEMSLMVSVGVTALDALEKVAASGNGSLYEELRTVCGNIKSGMPVEDAMDILAVKCPMKEIKKFVSLFKQNIVKGGPDFSFMLSELAENAWEERKTQARRYGEIAEQKLLLPTLFMFLGIVIMVIVPAFNNLF